MKGTITDLAIVCLLTFIPTSNAHTYPSKPSVSNTTKNPMEINVTVTDSSSQVKTVSLNTSNTKQQENINATINANPPVLSKEKEENTTKTAIKRTHTLKSKEKREGADVVKNTLKQFNKASVNTSEPGKKSFDPSKDAMVKTVDKWAIQDSKIGWLIYNHETYGCSGTYSKNKVPQTLRKVLELVGPGIVKNVEKASRGFISGEFILDYDTTMLVDKCADKKIIDIRSLKTSPYSPVTWIKVGAFNKVNLTFNYENMIQQKEGVAVTMKITGKGDVDFNGRSGYSYGISKADTDATGTFIDGDFYIKIFAARKLTTFLTMVGQEVTDLYEGMGLKVLRSALQTLTLKYGVTYIPTGKKGVDATYIEGAVPYEKNLLAQMKDLFIICKRGFLKTQCALLGIVTNDYLNPILEIVPGIKIPHMVENIKLFQDHRFPNTLLLQSSKTGIEDISMYEKYRLIKDVLFNENREDKEVTLDEGVIAGTCFRYRNVGMHNGFDVLVLMCPEETTFKFYLPDLAPDNIGALLTLLHGDHWKTQNYLRVWLTQNVDQLITIDYVEVSAVFGNEVEYKQKIVFKPRVTAKESKSGYQLMYMLGFTQVLHSSFYATVYQKTVVFGGSGEEEFLGSRGSFSIQTGDDGEPTILFNLNVPSNRLLILALRGSMQGLGDTEADADGYKTDFEALKNISLKHLKLDTKVTEADFIFVSDAELGNIEGAKFQLHLFVSATVSCFYKENGGAIHDILDAIRGEAFFDHTWLNYAKIGIMMSPSETYVGSDLCHMTTDRKTDWRNPREVGINIDGLTLNCTAAYEGCRYLKKLFKGTAISANLKGWMSKTELYLKGKTTPLLRLGKHVIIEEDGGIKLLIIIVPKEVNVKRKVVKDRQSSVRFQGDLKFSSYSFKCALIIAGDSVWLKIVERSEESNPEVLIYDRMTKVWTVPHGKVPIKWNEDLSVIEVVTETMVANRFKQDHPIGFRRPQLNRHYINAANPLISKFYSCKPSTDRFKMFKLLRVLGHGGVKGFFSWSTVKDLCIAYNDGDSGWKMSSMRTEAPPGFSMSGIVETDFEKGGEKSEMTMQAVYVGVNVELCVVLPVLKWGRSKLKRENSDEDEAGQGEVDVSGPTDVPPDEQILTNGYECILTEGYGMEYKTNMRGAGAETSSRYKRIKTCVKGCIKEHERDNAYNAININKDTKECRCVKNMRYVKAASGSLSGFKTCTLTALKTNLVEMYSGKGMPYETFGPKFCYVLPPSSDGRYTAYMEGYLKTFLFEMENAKFKLTTTDRYPKQFTNIELSIRVEDHGIKLFNVAEVGDVKLYDDHVGTDPSDIAFTIGIDLKDFPRNREDVGKGFDDVTNSDIAESTKMMKQFQPYVKRLTKWITQVNEEISTSDKNGKAARRQFQMDKMNRARAMNAYQRVCSDECGFVRLPGWDVQKKCSVEHAKHPMSCLTFSKDATYASNVACVSNCEAERVKSNIDAKQFHSRSVNSGSAVDRTENCRRKGESYRTKIEAIKSIASKAYESASLHASRVEQYQEIMRDFYRQEFLEVKSTIKLSEISDSNCIDFQWKHVRFEPEQRKICLNGFFKNLFAYLYGNVNIIRQRRENMRAMTEIDALIEMVLRKQGENADSREIMELGKEFQECNSGNTVVKVGRAVRSLPSLNNADFTIFGESTTEAFNERSPWAVARKRDALEDLRQWKATPVPRNTSDAVEGNSCSGAKRAAVDYGDITRYVHRWIQEHDVAKRTLYERKMEAMKGLKKNTDSFQMAKNFTDTEGEAYQYWMRVAEEGMKEWASTEDERLDRYNKASIPVIRKQIQLAYAKDNAKTLQDIFSQRSLDGTNAFKRANIEVSSPNTFSDLAKSLTDTLENGNSLEEISDKIQDAVRRSDELHKRTLPCSG